ncbi:uncharacterized protein VTP21DRAFT_323 [Calcarisporiella thermophila]|uniref:uncharacterized protein n=1 Tax=Calcarisporiella thermophila TaxID=911321 RepID=UPI0037440A6A
MSSKYNLKHQEKVQPIGREPNSAAVFHAGPRHDEENTMLDPSLSQLNQKGETWQDSGVTNPPGDNRGVVGKPQKDFEQSKQQK